MSHGNRNSKRKGRTRAVTVLGVAGALSLAGGASGAAVGRPSDTLTVNTAVTLNEEEISDVSLSTFYAFDHENAGVTSSQLAFCPVQVLAAMVVAAAGLELAHNSVPLKIV